MAARARMEKEDKHNSFQSESPRSPTPPPTKRQKIQPAQKKQPNKTDYKIGLFTGDASQRHSAIVCI
jgi:hypothetical protein